MFKSPSIADDDSVSVNSTAQSEPSSEYPLEAVLAEREVNGTKEYLVKWEGYPDERCTWETESNFQDDRTLREWGLQKLRIRRGTEKPYDVSALEERVEKWIAETKARKARRQAKRLRLGLPVASKDLEEPEYREPQDDGEVSSSDAMEYEPTPLISPKRSNGHTRPRTESSRSTVIKSESEDGKLWSSSRSKARAASNSTRRRRRLDTHKDGLVTVGNAAKGSSDDEPLIKRSETKTSKAPCKNRSTDVSRNEVEDDSATEGPLMKDHQTKALSKGHTRIPTTSQVHSALNKPSPRTQQGEGKDRSSSDMFPTMPKPVKHPSTASDLSKAPLRDKKGISNQQLGRNGRGPARMMQANKSVASKTRPQVTGAAILGNWNSNRKKRKSMQIPQEPEMMDTGNPKAFGKLSIKRRYEKAGRSEPAPNPDHLTFVNIKDGTAMKKPPLVIPGPAPKTPFQMIQENLARERMSRAQTEAAQTDATPTSAAPTSTDLARTDTSQTNTAKTIAEVDDAMFLDAQVESPGTVETEASNRSETVNDVFGNLEASTMFDKKPQSRPIAPIAPIEQRDDTMERRSYSPSEDLFLPAVGASPEPSVTTSSRRVAPNPDGPSSHSARMVKSPQNDGQIFSPDSTLASTNIAATVVSKDPRRGSQEKLPGSIPAPVDNFERNVRGTAEMAAFGFAGAPSCLDQRANQPEQIIQTSSSSVVAKTPETYFQHPAPPVPLHRLRGDGGLQNGVPHIEHDYHRNVDNISDVFGTMFVGAERIGDVRFRGLGKAAKQLFMTIKVPPRDVFVRCGHICTAEDYRAYFHTEESTYYGAGHVIPWTQTADAVESVARTLMSYDACGVFFAAKFTLLVYPAGFASWRAFDDTFPPDSPCESLRFVMRAVIPELSVNNLARKMPPSKTLIMDGESGPNALFRQCFGLEYASLLPGGRNKAVGEASEDRFFLMYPSAFESECAALNNWLLANDAKVVTSAKHGEWDKFATSVNTGVVLIHDSVDKLHLIPHLARLLQKPVLLFFINLRPTIPPEPDLPLPRLTLTRLFPHGAGILLTDSLILNHPQAVTRILTWFRYNILVLKPCGTWRLLMRPRPRSWLLDMIEQRPKAEGRLFLEIYEQIWHILPLDLMDEDDDFETPSEDAPIQCPLGMDDHDQGVGLGDKKDDTEGIARNDNRLVEWFAGWSRTKVEYHRKFHVVHGLGDEGRDVRKGWAKRWAHVMPLSLKSFIMLHGIAKWEASEKEHAVAKAKERERQKGAAKEELRAKGKEGRRESRSSFSSDVAST